MARASNTDPVQDSNGINLSAMLDSYRYVSNHAETDHSVVIYVDDSAPFYDSDAVIGLCVRKFGLEYDGETETDHEVTALDFKR